MTSCDDKAMTPLHVAAYDCDRDAVIDLLRNGSDPNARDNYGYTPLHWCAFRGAVGAEQHLIAEALLQAGADPNAFTNLGYCALNFAIDSGNKILIASLISKGANVNIIADDVTPLMTAAREGDIEIVQMLLQAGADPNVECGGFKAYDYADHYGRDEIALLLKTSA
ncbi:MAG: ankyrin repeat domain-containing protein [Acidobacteriota bacterium]